MKFKIMHESRGRIRLQAQVTRMSMEEADRMQAWLNQLDQVDQATVHDRTRCVILCYHGSRQALLTVLAGFSYSACKELEPGDSYSRQINREYQEKLVWMLAGRLARRLFYPQPLRVLHTVRKAVPYLWRGLKCLSRGNLHVEVLDALSIGVSMVRGDFSTAGSVMFLLGLGELLEEWIHKKSVDDLARSMALNIDQVWLKTNGQEVLTPMSRVQVGDLVAVRMGSLIPLDGVIQEGEVMVNQASLTGESLPVAKRIGMSVYAGTVVEEGDCVIRVEQAAGTGRYEQIVAMIEQSEKLKSSLENQASNLADHLVPYSLLVCGLTWLLTRNATRALSVLMVDFSCALKLAMPLSVLSAMREAGASHITVKGGKYLEAVAQADTIVFDKTGTLTHACPQVVGVCAFGGRDDREMLRVAACLEEHFPHSLANAVVRAAMDQGLTHEEMHTQVEYIVAHGIASTLDGQRAVIGSYHFVFEDEGCVIPPEEQEKFETLPAMCSQLYLALGGELAAVILVADPLRPEAHEVVDRLHKLGLTQVVMLTGDSERTAAAIAGQVGVDDYLSEVLPGDKADYISRAKDQGRTVIMIGDGINDSPALSVADAGVAISSGAAIARQIADITISADDLRELVRLRRISQALMERIRANYRFIMTFNGALIVLGALGVLPPAASALLHNLSTLAISLRSMTNLLDTGSEQSAGL